MSTERRWSDADRELVMRAAASTPRPGEGALLNAGTVAAYYREVGAAVLDALTAAGRLRSDAAADIRAHADQHAPASYPLNHPRTVLRRHLLLAARIAEGPLTDADVADIAAQVVGLAHAVEGDTDAD